MARNWETVLSGWTGPASDAEEQRYEWTKDQIQDAISASSTLVRRSLDIYPKGSYPAFTNVVRDSDVDIAVELTEIIDYDFVDDVNGMSVEDLGMAPYTGDYSLALFKDDVERALINHFGSTASGEGRRPFTFERVVAAWPLMSCHAKHIVHGLAAPALRRELS
jgi:hypothetical protein